MACQKCGAVSGDDWSQCGGVCPMPMSPHYKEPENRGTHRHNEAKASTPALALTIAALNALIELEDAK